MTTANSLLDPGARVVIAHRGNPAGAPENTIESFRQARAMDVDALEFDVRMTRDGVVMVLHDASVDRTTDGRGLLREITAAEARALDAGARATLRQSGTSAGPHPIPSLEEVLDEFRDVPLVIEVKELAAAEPTDRLVRRFGAEGRVLIGSAETAVMEWFYRSGLRTCASMRDAGFLLPIAIAGLTPAKPVYDVLSLPPRYHGLPIPLRRMAHAVRKVGVATHVWTVNDPEYARALWGAGVSGIVTDDPAAILRARLR